MTRREDEAEEAQYLYEHRSDPDLAGEEVDLSPAHPLSLVISVRLREPEAEADLVTKAAEDAGMAVSAFIRQAAVDAAKRGRAANRENVGPSTHRGRAGPGRDAPNNSQGGKATLAS